MRKDIPFEKSAMLGNEMPSGLTGAEQLMFLSLRQLYWQLRKGIISREAAIKEKRRLVEEYEQYSASCSMWETGATRYRKCEIASAAVRNDPELRGNPLVVDLLSAIYGPVGSKGV